MKDNYLDLSTPPTPTLYHDPSTNPPNPTVLPDRLLKTFTPIFIIRHPAKQVGSFYKASRITQVPIDSSEFELATQYTPSRMIFDYFRSVGVQSQGGECPIVVDGDDLINDTEGIARAICKLTNLDPNGVIYIWEKQDSGNPFDAVFKGTLNASTGVVKNEVSLTIQYYSVHLAQTRIES